MSIIQDRDFSRICAELASILSISISSARRKVDLLAAKEGAKDIQTRKALAQRLLDQAIGSSMKEGQAASKNFDQLLAVLSDKEENFMTED